MTPTTGDQGDPAVEPDTKDWTWVLERPCPECSYDAGEVRRSDVPVRLRANAGAWTQVLSQPAVRRRPSPAVWSPLEYACHVRDVHRVFVGRVRAMLESDDPLFEDWDQDRQAVLGDYRGQDPASVAAELVASAADVADVYGSVEGPQWSRPGRRSNGSAFIVETIARHHLHDVEHHLVDVAGRRPT